MCKTDIINFNKEISQNNIKSKNPDILLKKINLINYGYENIYINQQPIGLFKTKAISPSKKSCTFCIQFTQEVLHVLTWQSRWAEVII